MALHVLELYLNHQQTGKIYRAPIGDSICLDRSPELKDLLLDVTCRSPTGDSVPLHHCHGDSELTLFTLKSAGPYTISWKPRVVSLSGSRLTMTVLADPIITNTAKIIDEANSLKIDCIAVQSHLTKCCGGVDNWEDIFRVSVDSGYNMVHLTPVQELGVSRSSYSLHSHLQLARALNLNSKGGYEEDLEVLSTRLQELHQKTGLFFLTDVVWNHVSICNKDILDHPEAYYNLYNTPNLIPAYLIDRSIARFGDLLKDVSEITDLRSFEQRLKNHLGSVAGKLEQLYKIDAEQVFNSKAQSAAISDEHKLGNWLLKDAVRQLWNVDFTESEFGGRIDVNLLRDLLCRREVFSEEDQNSLIRTEINDFNGEEVLKLVQEIITKVTAAIVGTVKYRFIDENGPKLTFGSVPLVDRYFHVSDITLEEELEFDIYKKSAAERIKTCNGWTTGDSISDMSKTMAYTNREVVIWGDSVKLRYGGSKEDSPWLWSYMKKYTCDMAKLFHGFRIDNCHNTPLHVGEALLEAARRVRPNLYVVAELFTGSEERDSQIINRMGISSCIRELSQSHSPQHLGELIYHYGESKPCGSFVQNIAADRFTKIHPDLKERVQAVRLLPSRPHAMLLDQTHDNPCPFEQHPLSNVLALSGAMCAAKCSIGSNRGYDELVPHHIHVVQEERLYLGANESCEQGLKSAKNALIRLHHRLEDEGYTETFVDQAREDVIIVTRHNPETCSKVLVAIATHWSETSLKTSSHIVTLPGHRASVLLEIEMEAGYTDFRRSEQLITGLGGVRVEVREGESKLVTVEETEDEKLDIKFTFSPGCVVAVKVEAPKSAQLALQYFNSCILNHDKFAEGLDSACQSLDIYDLNYVMYRCEAEENEGGGGVYNVPGHGNLAYAGIVGFLHVLQEIQRSNDTGHALCRNLCEGWWQAEYTVHRLKKNNLRLGFYLEEVFFSLREVPNYMRPKVFEAVISSVYSACLRRVSKLIPGFWESEEEQDNWFTQQLVLTSIQLMGRVGDTGIPVSPEINESVPSLAAGLPHFSHGFMRCWGRDTFVALPGLLITTKRFDDARDLIVGFARTLRYGLIPNLLSERGHKPRYNCRDAVWWWCRSVKLLFAYVPSILDEPVNRLYYTDDSPTTLDNPFGCTVLDVVHELLARHAAGIEFREENAGRALDEHLLDQGFDMTAGVDPTTGFVRGGSRHNCGTWMDKVGSSERAGNKGVPATPRDGSAIELVAMCYQTVAWMSELLEDGISSTQGVLLRTDIGSGIRNVSYNEWSRMIKDNFEDMFWDEQGFYYKDTVGSQITGNDEQFRPNQTFAMVIAPELFDDSHVSLALRNIGAHLAGPAGMSTVSPNDENYRPYYDTSNDGMDCNIAHGFNYHQGPEWVWCMGFYLQAKLLHVIKRRNGGTGSTELHTDTGSTELHTDTGSTELHTDTGSTELHTDTGSTELDTDSLDEQFFSVVLAPHRAMIAADPYRGLTELTNKDGEYCPGSCPTQAWSSACLLQFLVQYKEYFRSF